jgi:hypothetical protein
MSGSQVPEPVAEVADGLPEHECAFCNWDKGLPGDYHTTDIRDAARDFFDTRQVQVCSFCYASLAASSFLSGGAPRCADPRDLATFANILLAEIRKVAQR